MVIQMDLNGIDSVYVQLMNEGTRSYRPAPYITLGHDLVRLLAHPDYCPEDEEWEFKPGSIVRVAWKSLNPGGRTAVAVELIDGESSEYREE